MALPTFVGIGTPKSGTTWVADLLRSHPDVLMAERKEVHYFDTHFERGPEWYGQFFRAERGPASRAGLPLAVGEFTSHYLYSVADPGRVRTVSSIRGLILIVRDPVERTVSHWRFRAQVDAYRGSFAEFLADYPQAVDMGRYATHLRRWLAHFELSEILVLVAEEATADVEGTRRRLAELVGVEAGRFPAGAGEARANETFVPRHGRLYAAATRQAQRLRRHDLDWVLRAGRAIGGKKVLSARAAGGGALTAPEGERRRLRDLFAPEVDDLERLTGLDLASWR